MSSEQIYYTYYSSTDWQHPNKVKYTENLSNAGDLLVTSSSGFENLNARDVITSSWGDGIQKQNDFNYNVSVTNGFKFNSAILDNDIQYVAANSNIANTIAKQITIDDFDYDTIFGLSKVNPNVIDYNWYYGGWNNAARNIFGQTEYNLSDKELTRIGPKLFLFGGFNNYKDSHNNYTSTNDYITGTINATLNTSCTVKNLQEFSKNNNAYNVSTNINIFNGQKLDWGSKHDVEIKDSETLYNLESAWPYKIQYNPNQWYHILTNGQKSALLTLPYYYTDSNEIANNQDRYYILNVNKDKKGDPVYSYYKLDKIVENNYYYIVSYFDTRPTIKSNVKRQFSSNCSSLFNENAIQVMPLVQYNYQTYDLLHKDDKASYIASCLPLSFTTSKPPVTPLVNTTRNGSIAYTDNFGLNPIAIKYEKNITISTTLNYTIANMTNLANILTGWSYLNQNFEKNVNESTLPISRGNLPYINAGIIIYIPTDNPKYSILNSNSNDLNYNNRLSRFFKWLISFDYGLENQNNNSSHTRGMFWDIINNDIPSSPDFFPNSNIFKIYKKILDTAQENDDDFYKSSSIFSTYSTPACINFNIKNDNNGFIEHYDDHLTQSDEFIGKPDKWQVIPDTNSTNFCDIPAKYTGEISSKYLETGSDIIKFVNTLNVPITNALNTTHTATDDYTFRLDKSKFSNGKYSNTDYFYIIGTYVYITKNVKANIANDNPHYLGFSPSTNITTSKLGELVLSDNNIVYSYPHKSLSSFMADISAPTVSYFDLSNQTNKGSNALMKDVFITPSLFMTINESVGDV